MLSFPASRNYLYLYLQNREFLNHWISFTITIEVYKWMFFLSLVLELKCIVFINYTITVLQQCFKHIFGDKWLTLMLLYSQFHMQSQISFLRMYTISFYNELLELFSYLYPIPIKSLRSFKISETSNVSLTLLTVTMLAQNFEYAASNQNFYAFVEMARNFNRRFNRDNPQFDRFDVALWAIWQANNNSVMEKLQWWKI